MSTDIVQAWSEVVKIPTYRLGVPDKNPMFLEKRVYQGSSGVVYPHPVIDRVFDEKSDQPYTALYLENRYLKIMILPEIGGRVQMALDKTNNYHFVYYNQVIKPALVGLAGPWISGGIEFNWPQHHRPTTFMAMDWQIEEHKDGSKTIWCSEIEHMFRTKGVHSFTLHPDQALLEINVQLFNRTSEPQTFLWWANPAVHVNDNYQSVFPPDVHAVMDHGKRDVSDFPIATGTYYKVNYWPGTDISRYKNIPVPTSYMAYHSDYDFVGCYDHGPQAGMMHIANHHVVPGKKQWTWGNSDFGQAWDRQLTDQDGPYIELMCGAFTDNQPDFSWIMPGEEKNFWQVFMPYKSIGPAKNANKEAVISLEIEPGFGSGSGSAHLGVYLTAPRQVTILLLQINPETRQTSTVYTQDAFLSPDSPLTITCPIPSGARQQQFTLRVTEKTSFLNKVNERIIIQFTPPPDEKPAIPSPAVAARPPAEIASNEELFLNGLHLEQYRHATYPPEPYYLEALRRDPYDSRCNNALGLLLYRRGKFAEAERYFRRALQRLTLRNPNPYDGEVSYNLGLCLRMQGRFSEAYDAFFKSVWNAGWQSSAYFELARLAALLDPSPAGLNAALELADRSLTSNTRHYRARHLRIALLHSLGQTAAAAAEAQLSLQLDPLEYGALWELSQMGVGAENTRQLRADPGIAIELALDYTHAGLFQQAVDILEPWSRKDTLACYTLGWVYARSGAENLASATFQQAATLSSDYIFPNRLEDVLILQKATELNPSDSFAPYYLGNFWYAHRQYEDAIICWERSKALNTSFATVQRNLGLAYYNKQKDVSRALASLETAFNLNQEDARVLFELDQLYKKLNRTPMQRLAFLRQHYNLVEIRDDLTVEWISLLGLTGEIEEAMKVLSERNFHPWEGGEGKVTGLYVSLLVEQARLAIGSGDFTNSLDLLTRAQKFPHNLGEGKLFGAQENNIFYYQGIALAGLGDEKNATASFEKAAAGLSEPASPMYYNDQPPEMILYQGLARYKLNRPTEAQAIFNKLVDYGQCHLHDDIQMDYFAVSLPSFLVFEEDLNLRNLIHCHYMIALGFLGLALTSPGSGASIQAKEHFLQVFKLDPNHLGAVQHYKLLPKE